MSTEGTVFSTLESLGLPDVQGSEELKNSNNKADSDLFLSILQQSTVIAPITLAVSPAIDFSAAPLERVAESGFIGKSLPASGLSLPNVLPLNHPQYLPASATLALADTDLEEFAVGLGIDRSLARLLLSETAKPLRSDPSLERVQRISGPVMVEQLVAPESRTANAPEFVSPVMPRAEMAKRSDPLLRESSVGPVMAEQLVAPESRTTNAPEFMSPVMPRAELAVSAPRQFQIGAPILPVESVSMALALAVPPDQPADLLKERPLGDEDILRWRGITSRAVPAANTASIVPEFFGPMISATVVAPKNLGEQLRLPRVTDQDAIEVNVDDWTIPLTTLFDVPLRKSVSTTLSVDGPRVIQTPGATFLQNPLVDSAPIPLHSTAIVNDPNNLSTMMPIRFPDSKLDYAERVEMFADQVSQRLIHQLNNERWSVSLRLDPELLGPMDISLDLNGQQVSASVVVASPEVRALLEASLPKLRESLESAGLNLSNWSFAQSNQENRHHLRRSVTDPAALIKDHSLDSSDDLIINESERMMSVSARAVDLFV